MSDIFCQDLLVGKKLKLIEKLGEGGQAHVWKVKELSFLQRTLAAKLIAIEYSERGARENIERIKQMRDGEARAWHQYNKKSKNVVPLFDAVEELITVDGVDYMVLGFLMPLSEEGDLARFLFEHPSTLTDNRKELRRFLRDIAEGLKAGHDVDIIHSDVKATNVLLFREDSRLTPKLMDFGTAFGTEIRALPGGTPEYMAPELFEGKQATKASDVYSLGILFYEIIASSRPFQAAYSDTLERVAVYSDRHQNHSPKMDEIKKEL